MKNNENIKKGATFKFPAEQNFKKKFVKKIQVIKTGRFKIKENSIYEDFLLG